MPSRVYHHYREWEDFQAGMWRPSERIDEHVQMSYDLLRDLAALRTAMVAVSTEWAKAAEQNLTAPGTGQAWLGQAACCWNHGSPEFTTRLAWWRLTEIERDAANAVADVVADEWKKGRAGAQAFTW